MEINENLAIESILEGYKKINSDVFTLTRIVLLIFISYFKDGLQFRELKNALNISDGKLISNINKLSRMGYIKKEKITLDNKKLDIYLICEKGRKELKKIKKFTRNINQIIGDEM